jgi:hypothetical protein
MSTAYLIDTLADAGSLLAAFGLVAYFGMLVLRLLAFPWCGIGEDFASFEYVLVRAKFLVLPLLALGLTLLVLSKYRDLGLINGTEITEKLTKIENALADLGNRRRDDGLPALGDHFAALAIAISQVEASLQRGQPADAGLRASIAEINQILHAIAGQQNSSPPPLLPPATLGKIVEDLDGIKEAAAKFEPTGSIVAVWQHISLIEVMLWNPHLSPEDCKALPQTTPFGSTPQEWKPEIQKLLNLAQSRHLTAAGRYRVTKYRLFFDPAAQKLSPIGMAALRVIAQNVTRTKLSVAIRAEADEVSDGAEAKELARERAELVAKYLAQNPVPVIAIGLSSTSGKASEPYHRIVHLDVLESCDQAEDARATSTAGSGER